MEDLDTRFGSFGERVTKLWTPLKGGRGERKRGQRRGIFLLFCGKMECGAAALGIKIIGEWGFGRREKGNILL